MFHSESKQSGICSFSFQIKKNDETSTHDQIVAWWAIPLGWVFNRCHLIKSRKPDDLYKNNVKVSSILNS